MISGARRRLLLVLAWQATLSMSSSSIAAFLPHQQLQQPTLQRWSMTSRLAAVTELKSWQELEQAMGTAYTSPSPFSIDSVLDPSKPEFSSTRPTLFRERHGWCPYSERVWLTLELHNIEYDTIRIDNTGGPRPSYFAGQTPQIKWSDTGRLQGESMNLVAELDRRYNCGLQSENTQVQETIAKFSSLFPKARPSSRAAYLFQYNGEPLWRSVFEKTLQGIDELLSQTKGVFFCGTQFTAADIAYVPFLERYRYQLPCLHADLHPYDARTYPHLTAWYDALDTQIPAYACRVKGDASSWAKVLTMAGYGNSGVPPTIETNLEQLLASETAKTVVDPDLWQQYAKMRPYVAPTPQAQAALVMVQNRRAIVKDAVQRLLPKNNANMEEHVDVSLRGLAQQLLANEDKEEDLSVQEDIVALARFLDNRMCVPRDMGAMPAACIKRIAFGNVP